MDNSRESPTERSQENLKTLEDQMYTEETQPIQMQQMEARAARERQAKQPPRLQTLDFLSEEVGNAQLSGAPGKEENTDGKQFEARPEPRTHSPRPHDTQANLKELDAQLEKLQMEILMSAFDKKKTKQIHEEHPEQEHDGMTIKDFLFSFRVEGDKAQQERSPQEQVPSQSISARNQSSQQSSAGKLGFLNEVNIRTNSEESKSPEADQEASKESWRSRTQNEELQIIQEDAQELYGSSITDSRYSGNLSHRASQGDSRGSGRLAGSVGTVSGRRTGGEEAKEANIHTISSHRDRQPRSTPSDILIKFKEEQNRNRPTTRQSPPEDFFEENKPIQVLESNQIMDFSEISKAWANQIDENDEKSSENFQISVRECRAPSQNSKTSNIDEGSRGSDRHGQPATGKYGKAHSNPSDTAPGLQLGAPMASTKSQDYIKIFESLLDRALAQQDEFLDVLGELDDYSILIDNTLTKSFKELAVKMMDQNKLLLANATVLETQNEALSAKALALKHQCDQHRLQMKELYQSHVQESQLQEKIQETQIKAMEKQNETAIQQIAKKYTEKVNDLRKLQSAQVQHYKQLNEELRKREDEYSRYQQQMESQYGQDSERSVQMLALERTLNEMKEAMQEQEQELNEQTEVANRLKKQNADLASLVEIMRQEGGGLEEGNRVNQLTMEKLAVVNVKNEKMQREKEQRQEEHQAEVRGLQQQIQNIIEISKESQEKYSQHKSALENMNLMYNLSKENQKQRFTEVEELKIKLQEQIKENLEVEAKLRAEQNLKDREVEAEREKAKQLQSQLEALRKQQEQEASSHGKQRQQMQEQFTKSAESHAKLAQEHQHNLEQAGEQINKLDSELKRRMHELESAKERINQFSQFNERITLKEEQYQQEIAELKQKNLDLSALMQEYIDKTEHLEGIDIAIVLNKDSQGSFMDLKSSSAKAQRQRSLKQPFLDMANSFGSQFPGVSTYAQAVTQAKLIDKFLKMDHEQKSQINQLKAALADLEREAIQNTQDILKIQSEKSSLEQLILEILSFGEQCDKQFDQLQLNFKKFETTDKTETEKMLKVYAKIKRSLNESVKNVIVEIEDNELRDQLLGILTKLGQKSIDLDVANTQMMNSLVKRVRDLLKTSKELNSKFTIFQERDNATREAEIQKDLTANQLNEAKAEIQNANENMQKAAHIVKEIVFHAQQCEEMKTTPEMKNDQQNSWKLIDQLEFESGLQREPTRDAGGGATQKHHEKVSQQLFKDLRYITDWLHGEQNRISQHVTSQNKVIELQLKLNSLVQENSLLAILNDKHRLINEKYKQSFRLKAGANPLKKLLKGCQDVDDADYIPRIPIGEQEETLNIAQVANQFEQVKQQPLEQQAEQLNVILNKVQHLKDEYPAQNIHPNSVHMQQPQQHPGAHDPNHQAPIGMTQQAPSSPSQFNQSRLSNHPSAYQNNSKDSSYYDHRGSFDLVNQSRVEKLSNKFRQGSFLQESFEKSNGPDSMLIEYQYEQEMMQPNRPIAVITEAPEHVEDYEATVIEPRIRQLKALDPLSFRNRNDHQLHQMVSQTAQDDQLASYRRSSPSRGEDLEGTSTFIPTFANTQDPSALLTARHTVRQHGNRGYLQSREESPRPLSQLEHQHHQRCKTTLDSSQTAEMQNRPRGRQHASSSGLDDLPYNQLRQNRSRSRHSKERQDEEHTRQGHEGESEQDQFQTSNINNTRLVRHQNEVQREHSNEPIPYVETSHEQLSLQMTGRQEVPYQTPADTARYQDLPYRNCELKLSIAQPLGDGQRIQQQHMQLVQEFATPQAQARHNSSLDAGLGHEAADVGAGQRSVIIEGGHRGLIPEQLEGLQAGTFQAQHERRIKQTQNLRDQRFGQGQQMQQYRGDHPQNHGAQERQGTYEREKLRQNEKIEHINELLRKQSELLGYAGLAESHHYPRTCHSTIIHNETQDGLSSFSNHQHNQSLHNQRLEQQMAQSLRQQRSAQEGRTHSQHSNQQHLEVDPTMSHQQYQVPQHIHHASQPQLPPANDNGQSAALQPQRSGIINEYADQDIITYEIKQAEPKFLPLDPTTSRETGQSQSDSCRYTPIRQLGPLAPQPYPQEQQRPAPAQPEGPNQHQYHDQQYMHAVTPNHHNTTTASPRPSSRPNLHQRGHAPSTKPAHPSYSDLNHHQSRNTFDMNCYVQPDGPLQQPGDPRSGLIRQPPRHAADGHESHQVQTSSTSQFYDERSQYQRQEQRNNDQREY